jgi:UDP:flavonoid glycosyltransferase YjiC (YdhE family)
MMESLDERSRNFFELLALAVQYAKGVDPKGLTRTLNLNDHGKTSTMTSRYEKNPQRLLSELKSTFNDMVQVQGDKVPSMMAQASEITPQMAATLDGVQVVEEKVASASKVPAVDLKDFTESRKNDNPKGMPENLNDQMMSFLGRSSSVDGAFTGLPDEELGKLFH